MKLLNLAFQLLGSFQTIIEILKFVMALER